MIELYNNLKCPLCQGQAFDFLEFRNRKYYRCEICASIFLDPSDYLSEESEKQRYETHNNDVEDLGYQSFVSPIVEAIRKDYSRKHLGLDYGAGTGPVISFMLKREGYEINLYDPYFHKYPDNLKKAYDYIICCEVIEHFYQPYKEFKRLYSLLKPGGSLLCMTNLYYEEIDFNKWHYKDDITHVFIYHKKAIEWIKNKIGFSQVEINERLIQFYK